MNNSSSNNNNTNKTHTVNESIFRITVAEEVNIRSRIFFRIGETAFARFHTIRLNLFR